MRILITGHCGYIGPVMTRLFHQAGHEVVGFDTGFFKDLIGAAEPGCIPDYEISGDIRDIVIKDFAGIEGVVHLAALSNDPMGNIAAGQTHSINTEGTIRCATMAKQAGASRFVFASSCSVYGASGNSAVPLDEHAPVAPVSAYAVSKVDAEKALQTIADDSFRTVMLRNATAYGVSPRMRLDLVLANLMASGYATGVIEVLSDGTPWRPLVHIEDISRAALSALTAEALNHSVFNIGAADCNYTVREIAEVAAKQFPECSINITGQNGSDPRSYRVDFTRALTDLPGFAPQWNLEKGAKQTHDWLSAAPRDLKVLFGNRYIRLSHLEKLLREHQVSETFRWL
ncbi:MAG: NAD(P)-dependent oxidoreductase [Rhodospirillaceae bacterium]|nr:NAD(P)-dependent oxidoreductase [Rhodospirillaceae bacterium]